MDNPPVFGVCSVREYMCISGFIVLENYHLFVERLGRGIVEVKKRGR